MRMKTQIDQTTVNKQYTSWTSAESKSDFEGAINEVSRFSF